MSMTSVSNDTHLLVDEIANTELDVLIYSNINDSGDADVLEKAINQLSLDNTKLSGYDRTAIQASQIRHQQFQNLNDISSVVAEPGKRQPDLILVSATVLADDIDEQIKQLVEAVNDASIAIILIAHAENSELLVSAVQAGASDFILLPLPTDLIATRLQSQLRVRNLHKVMSEQNQKIIVNHEHVLHEQQMAKQVFDKVAQDSVKLENIKHWLSPIAVFNGDVLLATPTPSGTLMVLLGDFTGHGLAAAIGAIPLASTFYSMAEKGFSLSDIIKEINKKLNDILPVGVFCCACIAQLDFSRALCEVWNAGLPDCYLLHAESASLEAIPSDGLPLGIMNSDQLTVDSKRFNLSVGDKLFLLSDGVLETENEQGEQYGEPRLKRTLIKAGERDPNSCFDVVKNDVHTFIGSNDRVDDISFVEIDFVAASDFERFHAGGSHFTAVKPTSWCMQYEAQAESLQHQDPVPLILHMLLEEPNLRRFSGRLFSIVSELYNNALDHGLLKLNSSLKHELGGFEQFYNQRLQRLAALTSGSIHFKLDYKAWGMQGLLIVEVEDTGDGFDYENLSDSSDAADVQLHGRGLKLLQSFCDSVEFLGKGNRVRVKYAWGES